MIEGGGSTALEEQWKPGTMEAMKATQEGHMREATFEAGKRMENLRLAGKGAVGESLGLAAKGIGSWAMANPGAAFLGIGGIALGGAWLLSRKRERSN